MHRRSPVWLLVCALALATGLTLLALSKPLVEPPGPGRYLPADASAPPDRRVADGSTNGVPTSLRQPLVRAAVDLLPPPLVTLRLVRLTFAPGAWLPSLSLSGPSLFAVEAGALTLWALGPAGVGRVSAGTPIASPEPVTPVLDLAVRPGEQAFLPAGTVFALRNVAPTPAVVLGVAVFPGDGGPTTSLGQALFRSPPSMETGPGPSFEDWPVDVTVQPLASAAVAVAPGPATLAVDRWTVAPGAVIPSASEGPGLLVVEAGVLGLPPDHGATWPTKASSAGSGTPSSIEMLLTAGKVVIAEPSAGVIGRNAGEGPLVVLTLVIGRDDRVRQRS
jgi:hypothetical protein